MRMMLKTVYGDPVLVLDVLSKNEAMWGWGRIIGILRPGKVTCAPVVWRIDGRADDLASRPGGAYDLVDVPADIERLANLVPSRHVPPVPPEPDTPQYRAALEGARGAREAAGRKAVLAELVASLWADMVAIVDKSSDVSIGEADMRLIATCLRDAGYLAPLVSAQAATMGPKSSSSASCFVHGQPDGSQLTR